MNLVSSLFNFPIIFNEFNGDFGLDGLKVHGRFCIAIVCINLRYVKWSYCL